MHARFPSSTARAQEMVADPALLMGPLHGSGRIRDRLGEDLHRPSSTFALLCRLGACLLEGPGKARISDGTGAAAVALWAFVGLSVVIVGITIFLAETGREKKALRGED